MNGVREIPLTRGQIALVDEQDYERVSRYSWTAYQSKHIWYARRCYQIKSKRYSQTLHRFILNTDAPTVDHINRNGLDCRRENLRPATRSQNMANTKMSARNTTGYRGVTRSKHDWPRPWMAKIKKDGKTLYAGVFATAIEAARAYDEAAKRIHGEFATLNFPDTGGGSREQGNLYRSGWRGPRSRTGFNKFCSKHLIKARETNRLRIARARAIREGK